jgi:hypothetical protein
MEQEIMLIMELKCEGYNSHGCNAVYLGKIQQRVGKIQQRVSVLSVRQQSTF